MSPTVNERVLKKTKIIQGRAKFMRGEKKMSWSKLRMAQNTPEDA